MSRICGWSVNAESTVVESAPMPMAETTIPIVQPMTLTRTSRQDRPTAPDRDGLAVATPLDAARRPGTDVAERLEPEREGYENRRQP
jgi:hypothetical protein